MVATKAKWFRDWGKPRGKPILEPRRPSGPSYRPPPGHRDTYRDLPVPLHEQKPPPQRLPGHGDPRFPGFNPDHYPKPKPLIDPAEGRAARALDRQARRIGGRAFRNTLGTLGVLMDVADYVEPLIYPNYTKVPVLPANYYWCSGPSLISLPWITKPFFEFSGSCTISVPIIGQAPSNPNQANGILAGRAEVYWSRNYGTPPGRTAVQGVAKRIVVANPQLGPKQPYGFADAPNPNLVRFAPGVLSPGFGRPLQPAISSGPEGFMSPDSPYEPDHAWIYETATSAEFGPIGGGVGRLNPGIKTPPSTPPAGRKPPARNEKQGKVMTKSLKVAIALYKALDWASESAEVVDAVYQALPKDVRARWEKNRFPDAHWVRDKQTGKWVKVGVDRPGDNFGQYGLSGADWKLQALWHNWHKVDYVQAVRNIIKNELSDRIIGGYQKALPRNAGSAHSAGERELAKRIDQYLAEELGL